MDDHAPEGKSLTRLGAVDAIAETPTQGAVSPSDSETPETAVDQYRRIIASYLVEHPDRADSFADLGILLRNHFQQVGGLDSLAEAAVDLHRRALYLRPPGHPDRCHSLSSLANALQIRFEQLGDSDSLAEAVDLHREVLNLCPPGHPDHSIPLNNLANALRIRFEQLGDLGSLAEVVDLYRQALHLRQPGHPDRCYSLSNLANAMQICFEQLGDSDSLTESVDLHRENLDLCPPGHPDRSMWLSNLGGALQTQYEQLGDLDLLAEAVNLHRQALDLRPPGHPLRSSSLNNLATALETRFEQLGDLDSLAEVVDLLRQALDLCPQGHPHRSISLSNLASALQTRFEHFGDLDSLAEVVDLHRQALDLCPAGHPLRSSSLNNLANALRTRFEQLGDLDFLAEAVDLHRQALDLRPPGHPHRSMSLSNLGGALQTRYEQLGDLDLLAEAVNLHRQALDLRPPGHPDRSRSLSHLADASWTRFVQLNDLDSLAEAVDLRRQALDLRPPGHLDRSISLSNLASALQPQFEHFGDLDFLAEAVDLHRQALNLRPPGHPHRPSSLSNLANALQTRSEHLGDVDSLAEAIDLHRQALDLDPPGHAHRSLSLTSLAIALRTRFEQDRNFDLLAEAVDLFYQALDLQPYPHPGRPIVLLYLTIGLRAISDAQTRPRDVKEEIDLCTQGLQYCADGHPMRMGFLFALGRCELELRTRFFDFDSGLRHILAALQDSSSSPKQRLRVAMRILSSIEDAYKFVSTAINTSRFSHDDKVLRIYVLVIRLLPLAASFGLDHTRRLRELDGTEEASRDAAGHAILLDRHTQAVEMLEQGRGVFWSQALSLRAPDLDLLPAEDADKLRRLFQALESQGMSEDSMTTAQRERRFERNRKHAEAAEALIEDIRSRPGMNRFLLPPAFASLVQGLPNGYVVMLSVSNLGHHALILSGSTKTVHTLALRLPSRVMGKDRTTGQQRSFRDISTGGDESVEVALESSDSHQTLEEQDRAKIRERATFDDSLADLWVFIVKPIIEHLKLQKASGRDRPRFWWCATGSLTFLPIHAAGGYTKEAQERSGASAECAYDYIVSSYIPSISALVRLSSVSKLMPRHEVNGLLVHEGSPGRGWRSITKVKNEARLVKECFETAGAPITVVNDTSAHPTVPEVLACLEGSKIRVLHLACHGAQRPDPLASAFILRDGDLSIQELMKLNLKHAFLAFLSACQTAKGDEHQPDQAVHLAASVLFSGFKSVIATMWGMTDKDGPAVAGAVYEALFQDEVFDLNAVPYALDDAVRDLREQKVSAKRWAVFVHMGA